MQRRGFGGDEFFLDEGPGTEDRGYLVGRNANPDPPGFE